MSGPVPTLFLLQVLLPLTLILANWLLPSASVLTRGLRALAIALVIWLTAVSGVWLFPPWWTPWALMALHVILTALSLRKPYRQSRVFGVAEAIVAIALAAYAISGLASAIEGRTAPQIAIDLAPPLAVGRYLVVSGGASLATNTHFETLNLPRAADFRGQSHAVDLIGIDAMGLYADSIVPEDPARYRIYGTPVLAPCTGEVAIVVDGVADMPVPRMDRDHMAGNHVILECGAFHVVLGHLAPGSIRVVAGDNVTIGMPLGQVGNSGNTATPHLHIHVQEGLPEAAPLSGKPVFFTIDGSLPVRNQRLRF